MEDRKAFISQCLEDSPLVELEEFDTGKGFVDRWDSRTESHYTERVEDIKWRAMIDTPEGMAITGVGIDKGTAIEALTDELERLELIDHYCRFFGYEEAEQNETEAKKSFR